MDKLELRQLPYTIAKKYKLLIDNISEKELTLACVEPPMLEALSEIQRVFPQKIIINTIDEDKFHQLMTTTYEASESETALVLEGIEQDIDLSQAIEDLPQSEDLLASEDDAPIIRLLNALFNQAIKEIASDIHIEPYQASVIIRMRIDGILRKVLEIPKALAPIVISRVKVMAKLDIAEKRIPQDGRIALRISDHQVDVRISTMPSNHGERVVMRILDKKTSKLDLSSLGMNPINLSFVKELIAKPHGIILVTGPTGSGKTTSLYAMLNDLNESSRNILTIEDPIEYDLPGIGQTQVNTKIDMSFAKGLRAMLRQDPDVVMIGEIRDVETAEIAVQASLTGHLVLSTLHTNTAISAIARLHDMGVEHFLLASSLEGLIAQRLVRRLCEHCKIKAKTTKEEMKLMSIVEPIDIYHPKGCDKCYQLGYQGRLGIYEVIIINETLRAAIHDKVAASKLLAIARKQSKSILEDGFKHVAHGNTTIEEVLRVCKM